MSIIDQIKDYVEKITKDEDLMKTFKEDPVKAVEKVTGKDLPDDAIEKIIDGVKTKISMDKIGGALGSVKNLF